MTEDAALPVVGDLVEGKYRVVSKLGEGAMGLVYRATDERLEREVALKVIRSVWSAESQIQETFVLEARAMARLHHPNVVEIYDFGWTGRSPYFVMQFIEGVDLEQWLQLKGRLLAVDEALGLLDHICRGVTAIHESGAVHRDLKPGNIIVGHGFQVAVADLGLAQVLSAATGQGKRIGSPGYIAPELIRRDNLVSELAPRMDIYAIASIAYELFTNTHAFESDTLEGLLDAQAIGDFIPISEIRPELPAAFDEVIGRALSIYPADRQASVDEFRRQMHAARHRVISTRRQRRIAVIDDNPADLELAAKILRDGIDDLEVDTYEDPHAALTALSNAPPTLIVTDLRMQPMDGTQLVMAVRGVANYNHIPIVVISAESSARDWKTLRKQGADGFVLKPVDPVQLLALVKSLIDKPMRIRAPKAPDRETLDDGIR